MTQPQLRAIDLYSGVGGWSLGLRLAGVEIVSSYERWAVANETNQANNQHPICTTDIRTMDLETLPAGIDIVVGSPPCTEFSFSNRGGSGNVWDGLEDIKRFLAVVDRLRPRWWVMENVPRVAEILTREFKAGGALAGFKRLNAQMVLVSMEEFGLPQRRRRCLVGNLNFEILRSYAFKAHKLTLGDVVRSLCGEMVIDPIYGLTLPKKDLYDHDPEPSLTEEELRINQSAKRFHPVYNSMPFPDPLDRPVRTITATCTRVGRESVIIADPLQEGSFRRLSVRERASLQGFPITYQFYGGTYRQKLRMIGNAIPPLLSYYIGLTILGVPSEKAPPIQDRISIFVPPDRAPAYTPPEVRGARYPADRRFRFAIPQLRLKSGVRFELVNSPKSGSTWRVDFYFGTPKSIHVMTPRAELYRSAVSSLPSHVLNKANTLLSELERFFESSDLRRMQDVWSHRGPGGTRPFDVLDRLDATGSALSELLSEHKGWAAKAVTDAIIDHFGPGRDQLKGLAKLQRNAPVIIAGLLVSGLANKRFLERPATPDNSERRIAV